MRDSTVSRCVKLFLIISSVIGTSSLRRIAQLKRKYPHLRFESVVSFHMCIIWFSYQVIPSHGNPQMRRTLFGGYLFGYCSVKYQTFHQVSEQTSQQTYSHQNNHLKSFPDTSKSHKTSLTCPIELTSGSFLIGRRGILVIPRNHLVS